MKIEEMQDLIAFGLTEREAKLYLAMLGKPEWRAGELYRITGIQKTHIHSTLEAMVSRQYCAKRREGRFNFYRATPPGRLYEMLKYRWENEFANRDSRAKTLLTNLDGVYSEAVKNDKSLDFIEIIQTPHRIHTRFMELMQSVQEEVLSTNRSPYTFIIDKSSRNIMKEQMNAGYNVAGRKIDMKTVVMYEEDIWPKIRYLQDDSESKNAGEARIIDFIPVKMSVFDRKISLISVVGISGIHMETFTQMIVHDSSFALACCDLFELYWNKAVPYKQWKEEHK